MCPRPGSYYEHVELASDDLRWQYGRGELAIAYSSCWRFSLGLRPRALLEDEWTRQCAFKPDQQAAAAARIKSTNSTSACGAATVALPHAQGMFFFAFKSCGMSVDSGSRSARTRASVGRLLSRLALLAAAHFLSARKAQAVDDRWRPIDALRVRSMEALRSL